MKTRSTKWLKIALPGAVLVQITACLGSDPEFFLTSTVVNAIVFNLISTIFSTIASGLTAATAMLLA